MTIGCLERPGIAQIVDSADSTAYEYAEFRSEAPTDGGDWRAKAFHYLEQKRKLGAIQPPLDNGCGRSNVDQKQRQLRDIAEVPKSVKDGIDN